MRKIILNILVFGSLLCSSQMLAQSTEIKIKSFIDSLYHKNPKTIGIIAHVESPKKGMSFSYGVGYADRTTKEKLRADQPGLIASNIKTFISATILKLVEQGKLQIDQPIKTLLPEETVTLFEGDGYNFSEIKLYHLLSHTSGIPGYFDDAYFAFVDENPTYRWIRQEQLKRTVAVSDPASKPGEVFKYADVNYLLVTQIIEKAYGKPFYTAMRELLDYEALGLTNLWMPTLEEKPKNTAALIHQYWDETKWDSSKMDISWDLYGGGGIACTADNLASFFYKLFNREIVIDKDVLKQIFTKVKYQEHWKHSYYMGIRKEEYQELTGYTHGGFWGTKAIYFPKIKTSIAIYISERDHKDLQDVIINRIIDFVY